MNTAPKPILIWGGGGHPHVAADLLQVLGSWKVASFIDNLPYCLWCEHPLPLLIIPCGITFPSTIHSTSGCDI